MQCVSNMTCFVPLICLWPVCFSGFENEDGSQQAHHFDSILIEFGSGVRQDCFHVLTFYLTSVMHWIPSQGVFGYFIGIILWGSFIRDVINSWDMHKSTSLFKPKHFKTSQTTSSFLLIHHGSLSRLYCQVLKIHECA